MAALEGCRPALGVPGLADPEPMWSVVELAQEFAVSLRIVLGGRDRLLSAPVDRVTRPGVCQKVEFIDVTVVGLDVLPRSRLVRG